MTSSVLRNAEWWPIVVVVFVIGAVTILLTRRLQRQRHGLVPRIFGNTQTGRPLLTSLGSALVLVAVLDPRWFSETIELPFRGRNVVVLLDASRSPFEAPRAHQISELAMFCGTPTPHRYIV